MSVLELEAGGLENVGFVHRDLYNSKRDSRKCLSGRDAELLKEYFEYEVEKNSDFKFSIKHDNEGRLTHCFWAIANWRQAYCYFGDVVVFDTTYNTNIYSMIFAPIVGVNQHRQTTLFGSAFLSNETSDSFEWLFSEWLAVMPAGPPKMIITDHDAAMTKAFANVLPNTFHRYCIWHILMKFPEKIGPLAYQRSSIQLKDCIWNSESPKEFEERWLDVLTSNNLLQNEWMNGMYEIRHRWIPAYSRHIFSADMTSSQRSEITHSFFKKYVSPENTLLEFITRFERGCSKLAHNEIWMNHVDSNEKSRLKTSLDIEETMRAVYTRPVFFKFQDELFECFRYRMKLTFEDDVYLKYDVTRIQENGGRRRDIEVEKATNRIKCSCMLFECDQKRKSTRNTNQ